ncbi:MAG TPA: PQQ-binding-like beta-propeller repeat protein [Acidobacteriota bacterium]|nr:PQQ-binding-like beta-propeller repeat protein [Acidobacteriota bacterium]
MPTASRCTAGFRRIDVIEAVRLRRPAILMLGMIGLSQIATAGGGSLQSEADNWPGFLGPTGTPVADNSGLPTSWSRAENVEWSTEIPGTGWSSPIVWGNRVFLTGATSEQPMKQPRLGVEFGNNYISELRAQGLTLAEAEQIADARDTEFRDAISIRLMLYCLDLESGELLWERTLYEGNPAVGRHLKNSFASETPVTDGKAVYAYFAHQGLYAYDFDGNQLWATPLKAYPVYLELGGGASPALHGDRIYILNDNNEASFIAAFDKHDGHELWRTPRVGLGDNHHSGWSSPFVWENDLRYELVTIGPTTAISYDMAGSELWRMGGMATMPIPTPFASDDHLYLVSGPPSSESRPIATVRAGARGDITMPEGATSSADVVWYDWRGGTYLSTPVLYEGKLYVLQHNGIIVKYDAGTGEVVYRSRIAPEARNFTASPWAYNGMVFCLSEEGDTYVIGTGDEYELLGVNRLDDFSLSTPAMVGDRLLLRTHHNLWSIRSLRSS